MSEFSKAAAGSIAEETVLEIKNLVVHYVTEDETVDAVNDISINLRAGEILGLGASEIEDQEHVPFHGDSSKTVIRRTPAATALHLHYIRHICLL